MPGFLGMDTPMGWVTPGSLYQGSCMGPSFGSSWGRVVLLSGAGWGPNPCISWPLQMISIPRSTTAASSSSPTWRRWASWPWPISRSSASSGAARWGPLWCHCLGWEGKKVLIWGSTQSSAFRTCRSGCNQKGKAQGQTPGQKCQCRPWKQGVLDTVLILVLILVAACHCPSLSSYHTGHSQPVSYPLHHQTVSPTPYRRELRPREAKQLLQNTSQWVEGQGLKSRSGGSNDNCASVLLPS